MRTAGVRVHCDDSSHESRVVNVTSFRRDELDRWDEQGASSRKQARDDDRRRDALPDDLTGLRRALASKPTTDKPQAWQGITAGGVPTESPLSIEETNLMARFGGRVAPRAGHVKYRMLCPLCGLDVQAIEANLWPVFDTLAEAGVAEITLAALAARVIR